MESRYVLPEDVDQSAPQIDCPDWARYVPRPPNYENHPPGVGLANGAAQVKDLAVGDEAWIVPLAVTVDSRGKLWVGGHRSAGHPPADDMVHVQRTEDGFRVLTWPAREKIRVEDPRSYSEDVWVVEFPETES